MIPTASNEQPSAPNQTESRFVSEKIKMLESGDAGEPVRFHWRQMEHRVIQVLSVWQDFDYPVGVTHKNWRNRRHRNYFDVLTEGGHHLLIYFDRGVKPTSPKIWTVYEEYL
jgi:hypothetical protein